MKMDLNLKKLDLSFQCLMLSQQNYQIPYYGLVLFKTFHIHLTVYQEHFGHK